MKKNLPRVETRGRMRPHPNNLFEPVPEPPEDGSEYFEDLLCRPGVRLERIVSWGQASPEGFWYEQEEDEWVMLVKGEASLRLEDPDEVMVLRPGDHVMIPARRRHRVEFTATPTVWLALWLQRV